MTTCQPTSTQVVNFAHFHSVIWDELDKNAYHSAKMINQADYPGIIPPMEEFLIKRTGIFSLLGGTSGSLCYWFDHQALIEEFDDLYLLFREFLETEMGLDLTKKYILVRYRDNLSYILTEGEYIEPRIPLQYLPRAPDWNQIQLESDPFYASP